MSRLAPRSRVLTAAMLAALALAAPPPARADDHAASVKEAAPADLTTAWRILRDPAQSAAETNSAADAIIADASDPETRGEIRATLAPPLSARGPGINLLASVSRASWPAPDLLPVLTERLAAAAPDEVPALLAAIASFRTQAAAAALFAYTNGGNPPASISAAYAGLSRLSGRDDIGSNRAAWAAWVERTSAMTPPQWDRELLRPQTSRADRQSIDRREAASRLTDALRSVHLKAPAEERSALLALWLGDRLAEVRDLGFEMASRELADTGRLDPVVGEAALRLMSSPEASVRASAAVLVLQLAPKGAEQAVLVALATETDPRAASAFLLAAARWPSAGVAPAVLNWIERDSPARANAWDACLALATVGDLTNLQRERVLGILRTTDAPTRWPAACSLLAELGNDQDRATIVPILTTGSPPVRLAAADALLWYPEFLDDIIAAAAANPDLYSAAARAALLHEPTAESFAKIAALPAVSPQIARTGLVLLAVGLPATDLLETILATTDPTLRSVLLPMLASENRVLSEGANPKNLRAIARGVIMLAQSDLVRGDAAGALAAIEGAPFLDEVFPDEAAPLKCAALVALGRIEEAEPINSPLASWLRGLELSRNSSHETSVAVAILNRFAESLTPDQKTMLIAIRDRPAPPPPDSVGPPSPAPGPPR